MPDHRTTVTELITGLGTLGRADLGEALAARPAEMVSVSPEQWDLLDELYRGGLYRQEFVAAWQNGAAFLAARDGLRGRRPLVVEWRGGQRQPGDEPVPADLRIDHVFLVSCKYLSKIVSNSSPSAVFDRLLAGGHGGRSADWFAEVAPDAYQSLYRAVLAHLAAEGEPVDLPASVFDLRPADRAVLKARLGRGRWPQPLREEADRFSLAAASASAARWQKALAGADRERALWRLLRIGSAPYFVLGASDRGSLRLRIGTAWDWRQHYRIASFTVAPAPARAQPVVDWTVVVAKRRSAATTTIRGHVEIRWSHGKFAQPPEAKVYLDTPHHEIPGYWPLA
ncbi:MAG TPA: hypothetical protein VIL48_12690 [Acidimicrobiales bacterium]